MKQYPLPELLDSVTGLVVEFSRLILFGDFNLSSLGVGSEATMIAMVCPRSSRALCDILPDPGFLVDQWEHDLKLGKVSVSSLSDHFLMALQFSDAARLE